MGGAVSLLALSSDQNCLEQCLCIILLGFGGIMRLYFFIEYTL